MKTASYFTYSGPGRIGITQDAPHGISSHRVEAALAPGNGLESAGVAEFCALYRHEILRKLDPKQVWDRLHDLAEGAEPVLLGYERPPFSMTNFCHRRLVAEWFERKLGVKVPEVGQEPQLLRKALGFNPWFSTEGFYIDENGRPTDAGLFDDD
jgi:hypothetical protein